MAVRNLEGIIRKGNKHGEKEKLVIENLRKFVRPLVESIKATRPQMQDFLDTELAFIDNGIHDKFNFWVKKQMLIYSPPHFVYGFRKMGQVYYDFNDDEVYFVWEDYSCEQFYSASDILEDDKQAINANRFFSQFDMRAKLETLAIQLPKFFKDFNDWVDSF